MLPPFVVNTKLSLDNKQMFTTLGKPESPSLSCLIWHIEGDQRQVQQSSPINYLRRRFPTVAFEHLTCAWV